MKLKTQFQFLKYYRLIVNSCFIHFDSLSEYGFKNKRLKIQKIICQYKVYKLEKNLKGLKALHKKFPKWVEVKKELEKLGNKQAN